MNEVTKDLLEAALIFEDYCDAMDSGDDVTAMLKYAEAQTARRAAIARAEASLAEPQPDADGWIPWAATATSQCPVGQDTWLLFDLQMDRRAKRGSRIRPASFSGAFFPQVPSSPTEW